MDVGLRLQINLNDLGPILQPLDKALIAYSRDKLYINYMISSEKDVNL